MPIPIEDLVAGVLAPLLVSGFILGVICRIGRGDVRLRHAAAVALVAGFAVACALLKWMPPRPQEHWQWLPYLAVMAMIIGPVSIASGVRWFERYALYVFVAAVAACFLVPEWKTIEATRHWHLLIVGAGIFLMSSGLESLAKSQDSRIVSLTLFLACLAGSIVLLMSGSLKFAQLAGAAVFALLGCMIATIAWPRPAVFRGAALAFAVLLGGLLYIGHVQSFSNVPRISYILIFVAPLGLWSVAVGPVTRRPRACRIATCIAVVSIPLVIGIGLAVWSENG